MNIKQLNELIKFCENQNLMDLSFVKFMSLYDQYCEYKFNMWMDEQNN